MRQRADLAVCPEEGGCEPAAAEEQRKEDVGVVRVGAVVEFGAQDVLCEFEEDQGYSGQGRG